MDAHLRLCGDELCPQADRCGQGSFDMVFDALILIHIWSNTILRSEDVIRRGLLFPR